MVKDDDEISPILLRLARLVSGTQAPVNGVQSMIESAAPEGLCADPRVHAAWALYFSKFITAYKKQVTMPPPPRPSLPTDNV